MDIKDFEEKTLTSNLIYDGKILHLYKDTIELPDGRTSTREYARHIGAVAVIPITSDNEVICVRQYRYPIASVTLEIPAGKLDYKNENHEEAARRELREETGAVSKKLIYLGKYYSAPAILDECVHLYLAQELEFGDMDLDEDEFIEVVRVPIEKLVEMILKGEIIDGKTQSGIMRAFYLLNKSKS